ncbi:MAG TPA: hypothetical protein VFH61_14375 [Thermoleophilia bacterium]|nr:hypothetical protein [Thermoleophilia bacterium]
MGARADWNDDLVYLTDEQVGERLAEIGAANDLSPIEQRCLLMLYMQKPVERMGFEDCLRELCRYGHSVSLRLTDGVYRLSVHVSYGLSDIGDEVDEGLDPVAVIRRVLSQVRRRWSAKRGYEARVAEAKGMARSRVRVMSDGDH